MTRKWLILLFTICCTYLAQAQGTGSGSATIVRFITDDGLAAEEFLVTDRQGDEAARERLSYYLTKYEIDLIQIRSGASPDGNTDKNKQLSDQRAFNSINWIARCDGIDFDNVHCEITSVGEDYETLAQLLRESTLPGADEAIRIIETVPVWVTQGGKVVSSRKKQLMDLHGGATWNLMREELFPKLQNTHIVFHFATPGRAEHSTGHKAIRIYFPLNDAVLHTSYHNNLQSLRRLDSLLRARTYAPEDVIQIIGESSPEGPERHNYRLAERRAEAVRQYVENTYPSFAGTLMIYSAGEAWAPFRTLVREDPELNESVRQQMLDIIDSDLSLDGKEARLKQFPAWSRYVRDQFGDFRSATIFPFAEAGEGDAFRAFTRSEWLLPLQQAPVSGIQRPFEPLRRPLSNAAASGQCTFRPVLGVSTNLLYDVTYIPNYGLTSIPSISLEWYPRRGHWTVGADVEWPMWKHWDEHRFLQIQNVTLWTRRYFKEHEDRFRGLYLFASANATRFGIGWDAKGWEGEGLGASMGIGHKWTFGRRFFLDLGIAAGGFIAKYDPYVYGFDATERYYYDYAGDPDLFQPRNHRFIWGGPTRAYISFGIDLFNRNHRRAAR